jgi:hypothetical protein
MNTTQIERVLKKNCPNFQGVIAVDQLPLVLPDGKDLHYVVNTDPSYRPGQHWIAVHIDEKDRGEVFDSFGEEPPLPFKKFMNRHCVTWVYNKRQLQSVASKFCGFYAIFYCIFKSRGKSMNDIINCFSHDTIRNDVLIHQFACKLF